jgi:hypothetical protein
MAWLGGLTSGFLIWVLMCQRSNRTPSTNETFRQAPLTASRQTNTDDRGTRIY